MMKKILSCQTLSAIAGISILALLLIGQVAGILSDKQEKTIFFQMKEPSEPYPRIVVMVANPEKVKVAAPDGYEVIVKKH